MTNKRKDPKPQSYLQKLNSQFNWLIYFSIRPLPGHRAGIRDGYLSPMFLQEVEIYNNQALRLAALAKVELLRNRRAAYIEYALDAFTSKESCTYRAKAEECKVQLEELYKKLDTMERYIPSRD